MIRLSLLCILIPLVAVPSAAAQSLHGSERSVSRSYHYAVRHGLRFARTPHDVNRQVRRGRLVRLTGNANVRLRNVSYPFVTPATRAFVRQFARDYRAACHTPLVVTSAVRPEAAQPENASERSVHPAGIAVDLHRPSSAPCVHWLRQRLLRLERQGRVDATEEHHPAHFHVVVLQSRALRLPRSGDG